MRCETIRRRHQTDQCFPVSDCASRTHLLLARSSSRQPSTLRPQGRFVRCPDRWPGCSRTGRAELPDSALRRWTLWGYSEWYLSRSASPQRGWIRSVSNDPKPRSIQTPRESCGTQFQCVSVSFVDHSNINQTIHDVTQVSHLEKQLALLSTESSATRVPPHTWLPFLCRLAIHGQIPAVATELPPRIREFSGAWPQTTAGEKN